ncbi:hypothetical protein BOTBODRAFT_176235 [Botryobasidium botryosum FD-172 SS1]|uniref:Uncharacterized protein n=1 Tax=Botryobasidium botryosum (strain FD-172 SS1) TaxID=930990 RepID=A0A067MBB3_BOTB1|nr:hypothetical protein BOTBODRAFT_176235 [Botryobasidium botryosum FD-172 SS1]
MSKARAPQKQQNAVAEGAKVLLKEKGIITDDTREGVRDLLLLKIPVESVNSTIHTVARMLGSNVPDSIDRRSVSRIALEGLVAADMQSVWEVHNAEAVTLSNDGTTNKHLNYESRHGLMVVPMYAPGSDPSVRLPGETICAQRFFGITQAANHQSDTQLQGWVDTVQEIHDTYNGSPGLGKSKPRDWRVFTQMVKGISTDHAHDQKRLFRLFGDLKLNYEAELLGEESFQSADRLEDVYPILAEEIERCIEDAGGEEEWEALTVEERQERERHAYQCVCVRIGKERMNAMSPEERREIALFIWAGCCMHKELNAFKGGAAAMSAYWKAHGLAGPMKLLNIDNAAAARAGGGAARERAMAALQAGGVKLASLAGAIFAHKDKKRGQQDTHLIHLEALFGQMKRFPDTSNGHYGLHGHAAAELIARLDFYHQFLELIRDVKETQGWTNIEWNVYDALHDLDTLTELVTMSIYTEHMSIPYMRFVRGSGENLLDLGEFHRRVFAHLTRLKTTPRVALPPTADYKTAVLDGKPWTCPDLFDAIARLAPTLPHLEAVFVAFCEGAQETWGRFTEEYEEGGAIASASPPQRELAFMMPTNDHNEGALGSMRVFSRRAPSMTINQHNARAVYRKNNTAAFIRACLGKEDRKYLKRMARERDTSKRPAKCCKIQVALNIQTQKSRNEAVAARRAATAKKRLKFVQMKPHTDIQDIQNNPGQNKPLMKQLDWHRRFDKEIPKKCKTTNKELMVQALIGAVKCRAERKSRGENLSEDEAELVKATVVLEDELAREDDSDEEE